MIIEAGTKQEFKRCMLKALPRSTHNDRGLRQLWNILLIALRLSEDTDPDHEAYCRAKSLAWSLSLKFPFIHCRKRNIICMCDVNRILKDIEFLLEDTREHSGNRN